MPKLSRSASSTSVSPQRARSRASSVSSLGRAGEPGGGAGMGPAFEGFGLVDLVAESLVTRGLPTGLGMAAVLGLDEVERAREHGTPLLVFRDVLGWLRGGRRGVAVVDWHAPA